MAQPATSDLPAPSKGYRPLIVLDPGHGGRDPGARKFGVNEKDVVLAFANILRKRLLKTGRYRVAMTRDSDVSISSDHRREERTRNATVSAMCHKPQMFAARSCKFLQGCSAALAHSTGFP